MRSKAKFWRFCMMKPRTSNTDCFCWKLTQSNMKGLLKIPCEHKYHTKYGSGSRSGHKGHVSSPNSKILLRACGTCFLSTLTGRIKNRSYFAIWPKKVNDSEGSGQLPSHIRSNFEIGLLNKKVVFLNQFDLRIPKMSFSTVLCLKMLRIAIWKKWRHQRTRFLGYMFAKNRHINLKFSMLSSQVKSSQVMSRYSSTTYCTL